MDPDLARGLYLQTGVILCLDAPKDETLEVGIDNNSWLAGPKFQGLKLIPPGVHFFFYRFVVQKDVKGGMEGLEHPVQRVYGVSLFRTSIPPLIDILLPLTWSLTPFSLPNLCYHSVRSRHGGDSAPRTSVFMNVEPGSVKVLKWDSPSEQFEILGRDDASPYVKGVKEFAFDGSLGAYPQERLPKWTALSNFLNPKLCLKIQPIGAFIAATGKALTKEEQRQIDEAMDEIGVSEKERKDENFLTETPCYFSDIPRSLIPAHATPAQVTLANMDKTAVLEKLVTVSHDGDWNAVLGELQFAFVCFLLGQSFEAFEQWKKMVAMLLACESSMYDPERAEFWSDAITVLELHLKEAPEDFFFDVVEGNNFLHASLVDFFEISQDDRIGEELRQDITDFKAFVEDRFGMPFDEEANYEDE